MWKLDRTRKIPLYQQIVDHMEKSISYGELPPGSLLPSERKLAEQLGVNRSTVILAYEELRSSGFVERSVGSGTRVSRTKWGITPKYSPNWRMYAEGGTFSPNLPIMRRIRDVIRSRNQIIDLASGELSDDLFPNDIFSLLMKEQSFHEHIGYDDPQGFSPLRTALVSFLQQYLGIRAMDSSLLVTSGSQQSLYLITQCLLSPGDAVAIEDPSYCYSLQMFQSAGIRIFRLPVQRDGIDPEDIVTLFKQHRIKMIFLNPNYQNPTGSIFDPKKRIRLLEICVELGIPIIEDDPFSLTSFENNPPASLKSMDRDGIVIYIGSLSKIAASGLRIGWMIAPQSVVSRLADARQQMDFGLSIVSQWLAERFLTSGYFESHIMQLRKSLVYKQKLMASAIKDVLQDQITYNLPSGGLNLWCKIHQEINDSKLLEEGIKQGVIFVPGSVYGSEHGYIRLSFAKPMSDEIELGIRKLSTALDCVLNKS